MVAAAQTGKCTLRAQQITAVPELFGLRLGMTAAEVKAWEPVVDMAPTDKLGFSETSFSPDFSPKINKAKYPNVRTISLQFLDGTLYSFWIGYTDGFKWNTATDFLTHMSPALGLTPDGWQTRGASKVETCDGLQAQFQMVGQGPSIRLTETATKDLYDTRRAAAEAAKPAEPDEP
jgi:hypothetical protein